MPEHTHSTLHARADLTGLVLAGGQGSRMGGVDKGLQLLHNQPLALHAAQRLAPQVGPLLISANRHHSHYAAWG
jgi:molybdenum cofactor guanylyltransferase